MSILSKQRSSRRGITTVRFASSSARAAAALAMLAIGCGAADPPTPEPTNASADDSAETDAPDTVEAGSNASPEAATPEAAAGMHDAGTVSDAGTALGSPVLGSPVLDATVARGAHTSEDASHADAALFPDLRRDAQSVSAPAPSLSVADAGATFDLACASDYTLCATTNSLNWVDCVRAAEACGLFAPGATACASEFLDCLTNDPIEVITVCLPPLLACGVGIPTGLLP